jgi:hypothetical protein
MKNRHEIRGDTTAIFLKRRNGQIIETLIDTADLPMLKKYNCSWSASWNKETNSYYVKANHEGKTILLHRIILGARDGIDVDHIYHDTLDNRKSKLRSITHSENMQNPKSVRKDSRTGIRGVDWMKKLNKWRVRVQVNGRQYHIGVFNDIISAKLAAIEARKKFMTCSQENKEA